MKKIRKLIFMILVYAVIAVFTSNVWAGAARVESYSSGMSQAAAFGTRLSVLIADNGDAFFNADIGYVYPIGMQTNTGCIDREGNIIWNEISYDYYDMIAVTSDNKFVVKKSNGEIVIIDRNGNKTPFSGSYPVEQIVNDSKYKISLKKIEEFYNGDDQLIILYRAYLKYKDAANGVEWEKELRTYGMLDYGEDSDLRDIYIVDTMDGNCYLYQCLRTTIMGGTIRFLQIDKNGGVLWEVYFNISGGWNLGVRHFSKLHKNGQIQIVTAGGVYHIHPPTPDLYITPVNTVIGDNTKASFNYSVINTCANSTALEVYVNDKLEQRKDLGTSTANGSIELDFKNSEGFIDVLIKLLSSGVEVDSKEITVDKCNLLNGLGSYTVTNPNTFFIINGNLRVFDDNDENKKIINDMKNKGINVYIIHNNLKSPLTSLLEE